MTIGDAWKLIQEAMPAMGLICGLIVLLLGTRFVKHGKCDAHRAEFQTALDDTAKRRKDLETAIHGLPTAKNLEAMNKALSQLTTEVSVLRESLKGQKALFQRLEGQVDRIDTFLKGVPHA